MEFLIFIVALGVLALAADIHEKYHERLMAQPKTIKEIVYV